MQNLNGSNLGANIGVVELTSQHGSESQSAKTET
jgi:hypothetical protein